MLIFRANSADASKNAAYILPFAAGQFLFLTLGCLLPKVFGSHGHDSDGKAVQVSPVGDLESNESGKETKLSRKELLINSGMVCVGIGLMSLTLLMPHEHAHGDHDDHDDHGH